VPVKRLLNKVRAHGIHGKILHWIESWLRGRRQRVVLNREGDRNCLEKVQQRAIKMVSGLKSNIYEERLRELNLPTLLGDTRRTWSWYTRYSTRKVGWITLPGSRKLRMDREL
jgi:hypothetical protein